MGWSIGRPPVFRLGGLGWGPVSWGCPIVEIATLLGPHPALLGCLELNFPGPWIGFRMGRLGRSNLLRLQGWRRDAQARHLSAVVRGGSAEPGALPSLPRLGPRLLHGLGSRLLFDPGLQLPKQSWLLNARLACNHCIRVSSRNAGQ